MQYFLGLIPTGLPAPAPAVQLQIGSLQGATAEQQAQLLDMIGSYYWPQLVPDAASWPDYCSGMNPSIWCRDARVRYVCQGAVSAVHLLPSWQCKRRGDCNALNQNHWCAQACW